MIIGKVVTLLQNHLYIRYLLKELMNYCILYTFVFLSILGCTEKGKNTTTNQPSGPAPDGMVWIDGGEYTRGSVSDNAYPSEGPIHQVQVSGFWMDETEVTNAQFRQFVKETGYVTVAERPVDWEVLKTTVPPGTPKPDDTDLLPGSLVFTPPNGAVPLDNMYRWWSWVNGADWKHPFGPETSIDNKDNYPVTHIAYEDAEAYAKWAGKRLPTEAEWEYAARGGKEGKDFAWGDELLPGGKYMANFFQGSFPYDNQPLDGFDRSAPVKSYSPNEFGLYDMTGNVWEWTSDWYRIDAYVNLANIPVCENPKGPESSYDPDEPYAAKRVIKGGSYLCSDKYCSNFRPSARMPSEIYSGQEHVGFRCVKDRNDLRN
jgi:formylglycine-generating enzyme